MFETYQPSDLAIVGMAGRFPKSKNLIEFWHNLCSGEEMIRFFSQEELKKSGIKDSTLANPHYVSAVGYLDDIEMFDYTFFKMTQRESEITDPQHRLLLECAWRCLENAGYQTCLGESANTKHCPKAVGVYVGMGKNFYLWSEILPYPNLWETFGSYALMIHNEKDFLATFISYKLNLQGPSLTVQTACSTSLASVHLACQAILAGECDMALAGGVSLRIPCIAGYYYRPEGITSPDGHCRAFSDQAQGMVPGSGVGIIAIKKLSVALHDGDYIYAVIKSSAMNNDGADKIGYTAPSIPAQADVISQAIFMAGIPSEAISYVEAHGTGTALGDPIEIQALHQAFQQTRGKNLPIHSTFRCGVGSVKTNVGHLDTAAGICGLIKTCLALQNKILPPTLHYHAPNPNLKLEKTPFYIVDRLQKWIPNNGYPLLAGVSSLGIGGTNVHVIVQEFLREPIYPNSLTLSMSPLTQTFPSASSEKKVCYIFPGQGTQYVGMAKELYHAFSIFQKTLDECAIQLQTYISCDIRNIIFQDTSSSQLNQTQYTQPILFSVEYSLAKLWENWGIVSDSLIGHSLGEYVCATLSGVFTLQDALYLVARRGYWMSQMPTGAMIAVHLSESEIMLSLPNNVDIAVINAPHHCVLSGDAESIYTLYKQYSGQNIPCKILPTSHAFHSYLTEGILSHFFQELESIQFHLPTIPFISGLTGTWISQEDAISPEYWCESLRKSVRFSDGIRTLSLKKDRIFLEIGPTMLASYKENFPSTASIYTSLPHPKQTISETLHIFQVLSQLSQKHTLSIRWQSFYNRQDASTSIEFFHHLSFPHHPLNEKPCWIQHSSDQTEKNSSEVSQKENHSADIQQDINLTLEEKKPIYFYTPVWEEIPTCYLNDTIQFDESPLILSIKQDPNETPSADWVEKKWEMLLSLRENLEKIQKTCTIFVLCSNLWHIEQNDLVYPQQGLLLGLVRTMANEFPKHNFYVVDVPKEDDEKKINTLLPTLSTLPMEEDTTSRSDWAIRGKKIWKRKWKPISLLESKTCNFRKNGVYLLTGGLGGMGLVLSNWLTQRFHAKIILLGRHKPSKEQFQEIEKMQKNGGEVTVVVGDAQDEQILENIRQKAIQQWGNLHGIIHTAGVADGKLLPLQTLEYARTIWSGKVYGLQALQKVYGTQPLDWLILCSSYSQIVGTVGQASYNSANAVFDLASQRNIATPFTWNTPIITIHWSTWKEVGMAIQTQLSQRWENIRQHILERGLTNQEACNIFEKIVQSRLSNVAISKQKLEKICTTIYPTQEKIYRDKPDITKPLDIQEKIIQIWEQLLGTKVSPTSNFLELGGDSLLALQMLNQVRKLKIDCKLSTFFEQATIENLIQHLSP